jgi:hypothetical protein
LHPDEAAPDTDNIYGDAGETDTVTLLSAIGGASISLGQKIESRAMPFLM